MKWRRMSNHNNMKTENTLTIKIIGQTASGKTTLAYAIEDLCNRHGIVCQIDDGNDECPARMRASWRNRMETLSIKSVIAIKTEQCVRKGII